MSQPRDKIPNMVSQGQLSQRGESGGRNPVTRGHKKTSSLGADIRGDTGAPAVSTLEHASAAQSPPSPPSNSHNTTHPSKRRKARTLLRRWKTLSFRHTWVNPLIVVLVILAGYLVNPTTSNPLHSAIFLSYPLDPSSPLIPLHALGPDMPTFYGKGYRDFAFVAFYIVVLSFTREFLMQRVIRPMAIYFGIRSRTKQSRFMEQVYTAIYFSIFGPYGLYVMSRTPVWYFNTAAFYEHYPHYSHEALFKAYYLLQASYWAQQIIVLGLQLEKPRKDFKELVGHHVVTLTLVGLSYRYHFTYIGLAIYITHDVSDFFLATSKTLNYINSPLTVPYFVFFIGMWVYLRHYVNICILYSVFTTFKSLGSWELSWANDTYKSALSRNVAVVLLGGLQAINLFWFYLIIRIAFNIVFRANVSDVREEGEDSEEDEPVETKAADPAGKLQPAAERDGGVSSAVEFKEGSESWIHANGEESATAPNGAAVSKESEGKRERKGKGKKGR